MVPVMFTECSEAMGTNRRRWLSLGVCDQQERDEWAIALRVLTVFPSRGLHDKLRLKGAT